MTQRNRTPTLADVIRAAIEQDRAALNVCLPGQLTSYDAMQQKGDVQPLLRRPITDSDGNDIEAEVLPSIPSVPIVFPRSGQYFISLPMKVGDLVTLFFVQRSIDRFMTENARQTDPVDLRMHDLADAIAMPGLYPFPQALTSAHADNLVIGNDLTGTQAHFKATEIHLGEENAQEAIALGLQSESRFVEIEAAINSLQGQINTAIGILNAHTHTVLVGSAGPFPIAGTATPPQVPTAANVTVTSFSAPDVKSTKVKAT